MQVYIISNYIFIKHLNLKQKHIMNHHGIVFSVPVYWKVNIAYGYACLYFGRQRLGGWGSWMALCTHRDAKVCKLEFMYICTYIRTYCLVCMYSAWVLCSVHIHVHSGCVNVFDMYSVGSCASGTLEDHSRQRGCLIRVFAHT